MKIVKYILIVIIILIAIPLVAAVFVKKDYSVEREITISKPRQEVFNYVKHLKNQEKYNKWTMMDPNARKETKGTDGTPGFFCSWDSDNNHVGKGEQVIKNIKEGERIDIDLHFIEPYEADATTYMATESMNENQTKVKWGMQGKSKYPMNVMNLFIDNMLGKDMETSLVNLKTELEK
jgi:hypothetical protein